MPDAYLPTVFLVDEFDGWWLIVELQSPRVVLVFVQRGQFDVVALRLDGDAYLSVWIVHRNVARDAAHAPRWW